MTERLTETDLNWIDDEITRAELADDKFSKVHDSKVALPARTVRALLDAYRRAPLPAIDAALDNVQHELLKAKA